MDFELTLSPSEPVFDLKAYWVGEADVYAARDQFEAVELHHKLTGIDMDYMCADELTDAHLDDPIPEIDDNELPTGRLTSIRNFLAEAKEPTWLGTNDY